MSIRRALLEDADPARIMEIAQAPVDHIDALTADWPAALTVVVGEDVHPLTHYAVGGVVTPRPEHPAPALTTAVGAAVAGFPVGWSMTVRDPSGAVAFAGEVPVGGEVAFDAAGTWTVEIAVNWALGPHRECSWEIEVS